MNGEALDQLINQQLPLAQNGDQRAFGRIVAACQGGISAIALAMVRDVPVSEDIAQDAFIKAWRKLPQLNQSSSFLPWLRQITRNLARDHLRAQRHRANPAGDIEALIASVADPHPGPSEQLSELQDHAVAAAVIDALPEESREVLLLYYREGQSSRQVAGLLGLQDAAVRKRLSRARERVREELLQRLGEFAKSTAPGAGFTAAVAAMLMVGAPPTAAAAVFGAGALGAANGAGKIGLAVTGGALAGMLAGIVGGLWGVWFGIRQLLRNPFDRREKREVIAYGVFTSVITVGFSLGIAALARVPGWIPHFALSVAFMVAMVWACGSWLPRIVARRQAQEIANDPCAAERHARMRRKSRIVSVVALVLASSGLLLGLWLGGRFG